MKRKFLYCLLGFILLFTVYSCRDQGSSPTATEPTAEKAEDATAKNAEVAKSFYNLFEKGEWAGIEKILGPEIKDHSPMWPGIDTTMSREALIKLLKENKQGFPDMKFEVLHTAADGDYVFVHYHFTGTNTGAMMGTPATNKKVDYTGVDLVRMKDGVAVEHWDYGDNMTFMKQMGMMPEPKK
jgi:predicted SnoaL-like aldol condensation-catalyzing enzyme